MPLILALGNPGSKYTLTRHNAGFLIVDELAKRLEVNFAEDSRANTLVAETNLNGQKLVLAKPQTFMNHSGMAAQSLAATYGFAPSDIWAVYDDVALPFGILRVRLEGSAGGHNGVKSLIQHLGAEDFVRFRFGVGEKPEEVPLDRWVLSRFSEEELKELEELKVKAAGRIEKALVKGLEAVTENLS